MLAALPAFVAAAHAAGARTLLGCSRKAFLGALSARPGDPAQRPAADRDHATTATTVLAAQAGVDFVRVHDVHDVRAAADALAVIAAIRAVAAGRAAGPPR